MPRIQRRFSKVRRTDLEQLTKGQYGQLQFGRCFNFQVGFADADELRIAWKIHGDTILPEFIAEYPGQRPFGWWFCDHGKERPIVNNPEWLREDSATPEPLIAQTMIEQYRGERFGFLDTQLGVGMDEAGETLYFQEDDTAYLERHGVLTTEEIECLASEENS